MPVILHPRHYGCQVYNPEPSFDQMWQLDCSWDIPEIQTVGPHDGAMAVCYRVWTERD